MRIVHKNANFRKSETDSSGERKSCARGKKNRVQKRRKKEAPVLALHRIPAKHLECVHMVLSPILVALIVNAAVCCYSRRQALLISAECNHPYMLLHHFLRKKK